MTCKSIQKSKVINMKSKKISRTEDAGGASGHGLQRQILLWLQEGLEESSALQGESREK